VGVGSGGISRGGGHSSVVAMQDYGPRELRVYSKWCTGLYVVN
jgi:hypothetical protein